MLFADYLKNCYYANVIYTKILAYLSFFLLFGLILFLGAHHFFVRRSRKKFSESQKSVLLIQVSRLNEKSAKVAEFIFSTLHSTTVPENFWNWFYGKESPRFSFEIVTIHQHIGFFIWAPRTYEDLITSQLYAQYPDIDITRVKDYSQFPNAHIKHAIAVELHTTEDRKSVV